MHTTFVLAATESFSILPALREAFASMARDIIAFTPKIVVSLIVVFVGWTIATVVSKVLASSFARGGIDKLFSLSALSISLSSAGIRIVPGMVLGKAAFWIILLFTVKTAADSAGLADISAIVMAVFRFLPKAAIATIILAVGFFVADLMRKAVTMALSRFGLDYAKTVGTLLFGFVLVIVLTVALSQLGIQADLLVASVQILLAALALALALALGFGLRDAAAALVAGVYAKDVFKPGTHILVDGECCELAGIGPLTTKLARPDGGFLVVPNTRLTSSLVTTTAGTRELE